MTDEIYPNDTVELGTYNRLGFVLDRSIAVIIPPGMDEGIALECTMFPHIHGPQRRECLISTIRLSLPDNGGEIVVDADSLVAIMNDVQHKYEEMIKVRE